MNFDYLALKNKIVQKHNELGIINTAFINELSNLYFVVGDVLLGEDVNSIIYSLVKEFNKIAINDLRHNLEISQYYAMECGIVGEEGIYRCENCEIVLKYTDTIVCLSQARPQQHIKQEENKYYYVFGPDEKKDCTVSRGLIKFFIKQKNGDVYNYTRINIVKVENAQNLHSFMYTFYQNTDVINRLENIVAVAINKAQSEVILSNIARNKMTTDTNENASCAIETLDSIIDRTKNAAVESQFSEINKDFLSNVPTESDINVANVVAKNIMRTKITKEKKLMAIMIPGNDAIKLQPEMNVTAVPATIGREGITPGDLYTSGQKQTSMNSPVTLNRASIAINAKIAILPTENIKKKDKIVPISQDMCIMVPNQNEEISLKPLQKSNEPSIKMVTQQTAVKKLENKISQIKDKNFLQEIDPPVKLPQQERTDITINKSDNTSKYVKIYKSLNISDPKFS